MTNKEILNMDKLEVCYTATPEVYEGLQNTKYQELDGFRIFSYDTDSAKESYLQIDIQEPNKDGTLEWMKFGTIKVGSTFADEDTPLYVWIRIDNRMLYTPFYPDVPAATHLYYISDSLNLTYNNITKIDVALDSNINYFNRIKKAVKNMEFVPVVLNTAYPDKKTIIDKLLYIHTADRERYRTNTIAVSSSEKDMTLSIYNKTQEIEESGKEYISEWNNIPNNTYRTEIRLKRSALRDFLQDKGMTFEDLYYRLFDKELLFSLFCYYSNKLIRFRHGRECISIIQL
ncbi:MAG: hypothetical protein UD103_07950 [Bacteroidales bacterium]|nr:hypothetical protein [Bacteroidales bacterium]